MVFFYEMHYNILLLNLVLTKIKGKTMTYTPILILSLLPILAFAEMSAEQAVQNANANGKPNMNAKWRNNSQPCSKKPLWQA